MVTGTSVKFDASHHAVVVLLGSHPGLATPKDATVEVVLATNHKSSSKLCLLFGPSGPILYSKSQLHKNGQPSASRVTMVLRRDHVVQKR